MKHKRTKKKNDFGSFIDFIDRSDIPYFIRDNESRFLYINKSGLFFLNIPSNFKIEGKLDKDLPVDWAEFSEEFQRQDRMTENLRKSSSIISTQLYNFKKEIEPFFCPKSPFYLGNECIGTLGSASKLKFISVPTFIDKRKPFVLSIYPPNNLFTKRELDIIFWLQQRLTSKEIARRLNISHRTVNNKVQIIYEKANVHSFIQFIEFCKCSGFDCYIPPAFINKGVQFIT